jgi:hypothetical protein
MFKAYAGRDYNTLDGYIIWFIWRPRPDLTCEGNMVAGSHLSLSFRSPRIWLKFHRVPPPA